MRTGICTILFICTISAAFAQPGTITVKKKDSTSTVKIKHPLTGLYLTGKIKTNFNGTKAKKPYYSCLYFYDNGKVFQFFTTKKPKDIYEIVTMRPYELKSNKGYYNCDGTKLRIETTREEDIGKGGIDYANAIYYDGTVGKKGLLINQKFGGRTVISNIFKPYDK
jgi:hypothetical protein